VAGIVAVPSPGDDLTHEVSFLFAQLDEIESQSALIRVAARKEAAETEAAAEREHGRLLARARTEADQEANELLSRSHARSEHDARAITERAEAEAQRVLARGRERSDAVVQLIVDRLIGGR
jgi:vacuolar-type H+-ATPase subunit H